MSLERSVITSNAASQESPLSPLSEKIAQANLHLQQIRTHCFFKPHMPDTLNGYAKVAVINTQIDQYCNQLAAQANVLPLVKEIISTKTDIIPDVSQIICDYYGADQPEIDMIRTALRDHHCQAATRRGGGP